MTDTCPACLRPDVEPAVDAEDYDGNPRSSYRCPRCGWTWFTQRTGEPARDRFATYADHDDPDAWEADDDFSDYDRARGWL